METGFDDTFLAVMRRAYEQGRIRLLGALGMCGLLIVGADWRAGLAWGAAALGLELGLQRLVRPLCEEGVLAAPKAWMVQGVHMLLMTVWAFAGLVLWASGGAGQPAAMAFFSALALYIVLHHGRSRLLLLAGLPALAAPIATPLVAPPSAAIDLGIVLLMASLFVGQAGLMLYGIQREPEREPRRRPARADAAASPGSENENWDSLVEAKAAAEDASRSKSAFLAMMSHEIRTPLNGVLGMTQVLAADPTLKPGHRKRLELIRESSEGLLTILNDVLDLAKVEAGKLEVETIAFDLAKLLRAARQAFAPMAAEKGLALKLSIAPDVSGDYWGDPVRIRQVLNNLISNALKFTEDGEIRITAEASHEGVSITVSDTGVGIAPEALERLFAKFEQADSSATRRYGGSGLGLAICRELCGLMGGAIEVESRTGRGSEFKVLLPLSRSAPNARSRSNPAAATTAAWAMPAALSGLRVLAAEDDPANQTVLKALLQPSGVSLTMVANGAQAVEACATGDFDIILMDIQMPQMDGIAAARAIRAQEASSRRSPTPIVALTANAMAHQVSEYFEAGFDAHVAKPIDLRTLSATLEKLTVTRAETRGPEARRKIA